MTTQHTSLPWSLWKEGTDHIVVHETPMGRIYNVAVAKTEADAEFIVRACNAHDDLLEALQPLVPIAESRLDTMVDGAGAWLDEHAVWEFNGHKLTIGDLRRILAAIAKATNVQA